MSILSRPRVAATVAKLMQGAAGAAMERAIRPRERFPEHPGRTEELMIPTSVTPAAVTVYRPESTDPLPAVHVNFHGGGYVMRGAVLDDPLCRTIAALARVVVINVDYVVAPQHRFPDLPHQAYDVVAWVAAHGAENGWDASRLTIGGQSAGGALAAAVARLALENGAPAIGLQVLHYPPLDLSVPASTKTSTIAKPALKPWMGEVFDSAYVPDPAQRTDRLVSPAGAADTADLTGKIVVIVAGTVWPILLNTVEGVRSVDAVQRETATSYQLSTLQRVRYLTLPSAAPQIMAGIRQSLSIGIILMVISEMTNASSGLGYRITFFQQNFQIPEMWSGIVLLGFIGIALAVLFQIAEHFVLRWYRGLKETERA